ncbi:gamma-glutamyltranspeptidase/glutathione hydrolase [Spinactinospora alkalitolerans]|uniref:Glutathione hydrolase proenzyme n=1 Tax=Spinactinospora alkalitolerans TaxID=687207 RepID=A0A852TVI8_9ACTN|nr:gamma-glutamyltransferase [Spinactinospora alkalitolerans]NYE48506.1 gamma-glutamyltranspeptidase/glutathione hydrolase [Spinactinospora alkalitolerans]
MKRTTCRVGAAAGLLALIAAAAVPARAGEAPEGPDRDSVAVGRGGAVATVDPDATEAGMRVLRSGGNAVDAAVAAAAALGVTEPYSSGFGGGGYFVYYSAAEGRVHTLDGRETAPAAMREDSFLEDGEPIPFEEAVTSGLSVGAPGTPATWERAVEQWGSRPLQYVMRPAIRLAERGFTVDATFNEQTAANAERFADFPATAELFLPGGAPPEVGTVLRNPDLADTYRDFARHGASVLEGEIGADVVETATAPPVAPGADRQVRPGLLSAGDLADYEVVERDPTHVDYRGLDVYGMAPSSSGGSTVGEALNIIDTRDPAELAPEEIQHLTLEASKLAYADRNAYIGDPAHVDVPLETLLSEDYARQRACLVEPDSVLAAPVAPGDPGAGNGDGDACAPSSAPAGPEPEGPSTTHLVTADRWGNVVSYTLTIEQTGGSGITVPGRGFLLNNELTDFDFRVSETGAGAANLPAPGKRPRSSMAPTIVLRDGEPWLALGSPGGATIITTVLHVLVDRVDRGMTLPEAVAAPRLSQRNAEQTQAEPGFFDTPEEKALSELGHVFAETPEIGAVSALEFLDRGRIQAVAEPRRRGGGHAAVLRERGWEPPGPGSGAAR